VTRGVADTSVFIARESGRPLSTAALPEELAISVITIGELRAGVLAADDLRTRDRRLGTLTAAPLSTLSPSMTPWPKPGPDFASSSATPGSECPSTTPGSPRPPWRSEYRS
jgi:hypothetical protein